MIDHLYQTLGQVDGTKNIRDADMFDAMLLSDLQAQFLFTDNLPSQKDFKHLFITSQAVQAKEFIPDCDLALTSNQKMVVCTQKTQYEDRLCTSWQINRRDETYTVNSHFEVYKFHVGVPIKDSPP